MARGSRPISRPHLSVSSETPGYLTKTNSNLARATKYGITLKSEQIAETEVDITSMLK